MVNSSSQNTTAIDPDTNQVNVYQEMIKASNNAVLKKNKKGEKPSIEIQKFIERKKKEELAKKSLEQTIEVDKQTKIQQNLYSLDKVRKKNIRQKSVSTPAIASKKNSTANQNIDYKQNHKNKKAKQG